MILKTLYLKLDAADLPTEVTYEFLLQSRMVCNYLEREVLARIKFDADGFNRISIAVTDEPREVEVFVNSEKVACVDIPFNRKLYERQKTDEDLTNYFMERLREGLEKCASVLDIPRGELLAGLESFKEGGLRNEWVHFSRTFKKQGLTASLHCRMTPKAFRLRLRVEQGDEVLLDKDLLETKPNELVFERRFKDVTIEGDKLVVTSRLGPPLWSTPVAKLAKPAAKKSMRS